MPPGLDAAESFPCCSTSPGAEVPSSGSSASEDKEVYGVALRWQPHPGPVVQWINEMMPPEAGLLRALPEAPVPTDPSSGEALRRCSNENATINEG